MHGKRDTSTGTQIRKLQESQTCVRLITQNEVECLQLCESSQPEFIGGNNFINYAVTFIVLPAQGNTEDMDEKLPGLYTKHFHFHTGSVSIN